ncbi:MAG: hypothetical protein ACM3ZT_02580 [Bacillota bacterium]
MKAKWIFGLVLLMLAGCATVQLPGTEGKQPWEVVTVSGQSGLNPLNGQIGSFVCAIDGRRLDGNGKSCPTDITFLPGNHTLTLGTSDTGFDDPEVTITQEFKAGEVYEIWVEFNGPGQPHKAVLRLDHTEPPPPGH